MLQVNEAVINRYSPKLAIQQRPPILVFNPHTDKKKMAKARYISTEKVWQIRLMITSVFRLTSMMMVAMKYWKVTPESIFLVIYEGWSYIFMGLSCG